MHIRNVAALAAVLLAATLAGCVTDGGGPSAQASAGPDKPMTHQDAALQCWMSTEKQAARMTLDARADAVTKCIDQKMKGQAEAAAPAKPVPVRAGATPPKS